MSDIKVTSQQAKKAGLEKDIENCKAQLAKIQNEVNELEKELQDQQNSENENSIVYLCNSLEQLANDGKYAEISQKMAQIEAHLTNSAFQVEFATIMQALSQS